MTKKSNSNQAARGEAPEANPETEQPATEEPASLRAERDDLLARLQRVSADYLNYQKRARRDAEEAREYANAQLMRDLLSVLDDMELAMEAARKNHDEDDPLLKGMGLVHDKALSILEKSGLSSMHVVGEAFDPDRHQALLTETTDRHPPEMVVRELQKGYELKGRTLRAARVVVAKAPDADAKAPAEEPARDHDTEADEDADASGEID